MKFKNLDYIDSLRGIAILLVLVVHSGILFSLMEIQIPESIKTLMSFGQFGVILFFLVSAYTLFRSLDTRKEESMMYFFIRRFFRIAPLYYLVIIFLFFTTTGVHEYLDANIREITLSNLLLHIIFLNGFSSTTFNSIIGVEWTIFVEVWFYMILPLVYVYRKYFNLILISFLAIAGLTFAYLLGFHIDGLLYTAIYKSPLIQFLPFFIGCFIYIHETNTTINDYFANYGYYILGGLAIMLTFLISYSVPLLFIIMTGIFSLFFMVIKNNEIKLFNNKFLQYVGKISYSLYLSHFVILYFIKENWGTFFFKDWDHLSLSLSLLVFGIIFLISHITYYLIEVRFIKIGQKIIKKINS